MCPKSGIYSGSLKRVGSLKRIGSLKRVGSLNNIYEYLIFITVKSLELSRGLCYNRQCMYYSTSDNISQDNSKKDQ